MPPSHPEHVGLRALVGGFLRDEGDRVVERVLEQARTEARVRGDAARNYHRGVDVRRMLEEFTVSGPQRPRQESVVHC